MQFRNLRGIREDRDIKQREVADYYGVSIDYLLDRTNNPKVQK